MNNTFQTEIFKEAWSKVNYGSEANANPERMVKRLVVKVALGYGIGSGSTSLLREIGFLNGNNLTDGAKDLLFEMCEITMYPKPKVSSGFTTYDTSNGNCGLCGRINCSGTCFK